MTTTHTSVRTHLLRLVALCAVLALGSTLSPAQQAATMSDDSPDPALANLAPADAVAAQANPTQDQGGYPQQAPAPIVREAPGRPVAALAQDNSYNAPPAITEQPGGDAQTDAAVAAGQQALDDADTNVDASVSADQPPPPLPDYDQPPAPADDDIWTPGYWAYGPVGYYWVPGVWIVPPYYGALWTPPYWGWYGGRYWYHHGYWGLHVGFYGGVNYGFGYIGVGYFGGYWNGGHFFYNRAVTNVGVGVTRVYSHTVVYAGHTYGPRPVSRTSYNGGRGGIAVAPRPAEVAAMHESHLAPLAGQARLHASAAANPQAAFSANQGRPAVAVQARPLGGARVPSADAAGFHQRTNVQPQRQNTEPRPQPQSRPAPQARPAPRPAEHPAEHHDNKH